MWAVGERERKLTVLYSNASHDLEVSRLREVLAILCHSRASDDEPVGITLHGIGILLWKHSQSSVHTTMWYILLCELKVQ